MKRNLGILLLVVGMASGAALAGPLYVGASVGESTVEISESGSHFNGSDTSYKAYAGFRFMKFFGVEGSYLDLGSAEDHVSGDDITVDVTAWDAFAVGILPIGKHFEIFGKLGLVVWDSDTSISGPIPDSGSDSGNDPAYGLGLAFRFGEHFAIRGEYERFEIDDTDKVDEISVGAEFRFQQGDTSTPDLPRLLPAGARAGSAERLPAPAGSRTGGARAASKVENCEAIEKPTFVKAARFRRPTLRPYG